MTMSFSTNLIAVARRLLNTYGEELTFTRVAEGAYNVADGTVAAGTTTNYTADCASVDYNADEVDDKTILKNDIGLWIEKPASEVPAVGDTVVLNSATYRLINVQTYRAQGTDIVYRAQLRL